MQKKIAKQREKILKLESKKNDISEKLQSVKDELKHENEVLDNMEKEYIGQFMKERQLSAEDIISQLLDADKSEEGATDLEFDGMSDDFEGNDSHSFWK